MVIEEIKEYLAELSVSYKEKVDEDGDWFLYADGVIISLEENGQYLSLSLQLLEFKEYKPSPQFLQTLLDVQGAYKLVKFSYDDNIVVISVDVALEDGKITARQFQRYLIALIGTASGSIIPLEEVILKDTLSSREDKLEEVYERVLKSIKSASRALSN